MSPAFRPQDRRDRSRYTVGLPVRLFIEGITDPLLAELSDLSATGCLLVSEEASFLADPGDRLAFGFVMSSRRVGLVRGRVVRRAVGYGLGITIEAANDAFDELLGSLAASGRVAA